MTTTKALQKFRVRLFEVSTVDYEVVAEDETEALHKARNGLCEGEPVTDFSHVMDDTFEVYKQPE